MFRKYEILLTPHYTEWCEQNPWFSDCRQALIFVSHDDIPKMRLFDEAIAAVRRWMVETDTPMT